MGIALLSIADLFMPLQSLASRWMPAGRKRGGLSSGLRYVGVRPSCAARPGAAPASGADVPSTARPLRVVRMIDAEQPSRRTHRLVISGRMADVCAELDRLVALEAASASPRAALGGAGMTQRLH